MLLISVYFVNGNSEQRDFINNSQYIILLEHMLSMRKSASVSSMPRLSASVKQV